MPWDAIIVGGGPAGAATGHHLAAAGHAVCVLDRARFPRPKPCGEFLSPGATPLLEELGVREAIEAAGAARIERVRISQRAGPVLDLAPTGVGGVRAWGYALRRERLDAILLNAARTAGATVFEGHRVDGIDLTEADDRRVNARDDRGNRVRFEGRLIVGAGGRNCPVARSLGVQRRGRRQRFDLLAHWTTPLDPGGAQPACDLRLIGDRYVASAPVGGGRTNVNVVVPAEALRGTPEPERLYRSQLEQAGVRPWLGGEMTSAVTTTDVTPIRATSVVGDGVLLVGDAGLFLDPFTGQGIYLALRGAALAARVADRALRSGRVDRAALAPWGAAHAAEFDAKRRVSETVQAVVLRPRMARRLAIALGEDPALAATIARATADLAPARQVWSARFGARVIRGAFGGGRRRYPA